MIDPESPTLTEDLRKELSKRFMHLVDLENNEETVRKIADIFEKFMLEMLEKGIITYTKEDER